MTTTIDLNTILPWSAPKRVNTKRGERMLRKCSQAQVTDEFRRAWSSDKATLQAAGIGWSKDSRTGDWEVTWWQPLDAQTVAKESAAIEQSRAASADFAVPCPAGLTYLPYQIAGIRYASERAGVLIGDEMGLGKTIQAIGTRNLMPDGIRVLVICPASLRINWQREWMRWSTHPDKVGIVEGKNWPDGCNVVCVNYDVLKNHREKLAAQWHLLITDECHYLKNPKAQRTIAVLGGKDSPAIQASRRCFLTGTPILNRPIEAWPLVHSLCPTEFGSWFTYAKRYCAGVQTSFGWDVSGSSNLEELQIKLRRSCMVRRLKKDVLTELPPKRRQIIEIPANGAGKDVRAESEAWDSAHDRVAELKARAELAKASDNPADYEAAVAALQEGASAAFAEVAKLRHQTALAKVPHVIEHLRECLDGGGKIVVFAHHLDVIAQIREAFPGCVVITGDTSLEDRQAAVDRFQTDPTCPMFVGNMKAAGVGWTLHASSHVVFAELDWVPANVSQAEDRTHRIGQIRSVLVQHLVLEGSLDAKMARTIVEKQRISDAALDTVTERAEPVLPITTHVSVTIKEMDAEAPKITPEQSAAILQALKIVAGVCDGAFQLDGQGFSKVDAAIGHSLAAGSRLSPKQAVIGKRLVNKYRRQVPAELLATALGGKGEA